MKWRSSRAPSAWLRSGSLAVFLIFGIYFFSHQTEDNEQKLKISLKDLGDPCSGLDAARIVVSVKTGATEAAEKIPPQMRTTLRCIKNILIFSDLEQDLGKFHIYDALDTVSPSVVSSNSDFEFYTQQQEVWKEKGNVDSLKGLRSTKNPKELAAWRLDKYKFVHVLEKTWRMKPNMDWYFVIDADTYILWPNMLEWLSALDPMKKSYFGSEVSMSGMRFAHGGSGIILSRAAVYELVVANNGTAEKWDSRTYEKCCGDLVLGEALKEYGIELQDVWPLMSGESPYTFPFGPGTPEYWCRPALSMHHLTPVDMTEFSRFEDGMKAKPGTLTHSELFKDLLLDLIPSERQNWDNIASDKGEFGKTGGVSSEISDFAGCKEACETDPKCFQYSHHGHTCYIGMSVRLGYSKEVDADGAWGSGWHRARLESWLSRQTECPHPTFPLQEDQNKILNDAGLRLI